MMRFSTLSRMSYKLQIRILGFLAPLLLVSAAFSQDSSSIVVPVSNPPLNLTELSAKDTVGFETYSRRLAIVQDSISAEYRAIDEAKKNAELSMPKLEPKGEFEKQAEYETREEKWNKELAEKAEHEAKPHTLHLAELEKAKKKIEENQAALYSSVSIKSNPEAASIWIGRDEIGATPADFEYLIPGTVKISIRKEGYNPWDTTFQAVPEAKFKINATLEKKGIFSAESEINFTKILNKDSTIEGYESRIKTLEAREAQVAKELDKILEDFPNKYPTLEPQKPNETPEAFNRRYDIWTREGMRQVAELQKKHEDYKQKLERSIAVLQDYIIAIKSTVISELSPQAKIELGSYDADKEQFEFLAQDSASEKSPFLFKGNVGIARDVAKDIDRAAPGFVMGLQYINFPFKVDSVNVVNLAMSKLLLSKNGLDLKVEGSFGEVERYKSIDGYEAWKHHADSLLSGQLKFQGLDYNYAMGKAAVEEATQVEYSSGGLGWRGWTRIAAYTLAVGCAGAAVFKHLRAEDYKDKIAVIDRNAEKKPPTEARYKNWRKNYLNHVEIVEDSETQRLIYGIGAGILTLGGTATFFF